MSIDTDQKQSRLERTLAKIELQLDYLMNVTDSVLKKLKRDLKENLKEAVKFICDCFDDIPDGNGFMHGWQKVRLQTMLIETNFEG